MRSSLSFSEILENQLEKTSAEASTESFSNTTSSSWETREFDTTPAHLAFLLGQCQRSPKAPTQLQRKNLYPAPKARPKPLPRPHTLTSEQQFATQKFMLWGEILSPAFTRNDLKAAFRRLAKRLHPDHSRGSGQEFMAMRECYRQLLSVF